MPPSLTAAERRWGLAAAIASVSVFGLSVGEGIPLLSLILESHGTNPTLNGLNAAATYVGVILGPVLAPRCARALGIRDFLLACFALDILTTALLKVFPGIGAWFVLRLTLGIVGSAIFTTSEAWINLLASDAGRGRVIGVYATALAAGFGIGPLLLSLTGIEGWAPFVANNVISAMAALPLLGVGARTREIGRERGAGPFAMLARAPFLLFAVAVFGMYETALMALLPIWGVRIGLSDSLAAGTVSAVYIGAIALQFPIGWLSDKISRLAVLRWCGVVGLVGGAVMMLAAAKTPTLYALLFVWGGIASGIYPIALGMAGERFTGGDLVGINAAIVIAYGVGSCVGPTLGGAAMQLWNPQGLFALFVVLFGGFALATLAAPGTIARRTGG